MNKRIINILLLIIVIVFINGCTTTNTKNLIDEKIDTAKQEISGQISQSVQKSIDNQIDSISYNIESKLDPMLGKLRTNMSNIKETAQVYYNINKIYPDIDIIQTFFKESFSEMQIEYKVENNNTMATIRYTGEKYNKEKVNDILLGK